MICIQGEHDFTLRHLKTLTRKENFCKISTRLTRNHTSTYFKNVLIELNVRENTTSFSTNHPFFICEVVVCA